MGTLLNNQEQALAAQLFEVHAAAFPGFEPQPCPDLGALPSSLARAAAHACSQLGFIPADAWCLAQAWHRQALRLDRGTPLDWPCEPADFGLRPPDAEPRFPSCPAALGLYAVLPDAAWVARMADARVPTVQLRYKSEDRAAIRREVRAAVDAVAGSGSRLFINDHWREAIDAGAYGVHLGQEDLDALDASALRELQRSGLRLGVSTHGYAEMVRADAVGPSYIALGAVFPTTLKRMATAPQGLQRLAAYARLMRHYPLVAIGGIGLEAFPAVRRTGVGSIAVVRALVAAPDPHAAAAELMAALD